MDQDVTQAQPEEALDAAQQAPAKKPIWVRLLGLVAILVGVYLVAKFTGLTDELTVEGLRTRVQAAGVWGVLILLAAFVIGSLVQIPGMLFVSVGILAYGRVLGGALGLGGGLLALSVSFLIVRNVGGQALTEIKSPLARKVFARLDRCPIATVALLRLLFQFSPPLNYALAMSSLRFRDYFLGSALGLAPVMLVVACLFERFVG